MIEILLSVIFTSLPTILVIVFIYWSLKENFFNFAVSNDKRLSELEQQNKEIRQELESIKQMIKDRK